MEWQIILNKVIILAKETGDFILEQFADFSKDAIESKGRQDFVSYVDKEAEQKLVDGLRLILPDSGFIAEENTAGHSNEKMVWVVDPLDGTTNFIHGVAPFAISIALQEDDKTVLGLVYELGHKEMFYSCKGQAAYCNGKKLHVSSAKRLNQSLIATGFHINDYSRLDGHLKVVKAIVEGSHGLRRHGSAATDLAYVAAGRFDGYFEYGLNPWDVAAGAFLVQQAGGLVSDYTGGVNYFFGREIVAANREVHGEMLALLKNNMR
jgi:myo-inositol-1(or 4)-monophosphatase